MVPITSSLPSVRGLEFLLFDGSAGVLLQSQWGVLRLCALWEPPITSRVVDYHSVEELGFQLLDSSDVTVLQGGAV
jgi:hypothetical protein